VSFNPDNFLFRKFYIPGEPSPKGLIYNTWAQRVALFEEDSAEILDLLVRSHGQVEPAISYMLANGQFESCDPVAEANETLSEFIDSLREASLLTNREEAMAQPNGGLSEEMIRRTMDPGMNPELQIAGVMGDHHLLYSLVLELTYRCNERCIHCYCPENRDLDDMPTQVVLNLLKEFREMGGFRLQLTGGELLLRKDILTILTAAKEHGFLVDIITNLTLLSPEILEGLIALAPREVGCSVYSADPKIHDEITQVPGSFEKTMNSVSRLRREGIPVLLKSPLMKNTISGWQAIKELAEKNQCGWQCDLSITPRNDGGQNPLDLRVWDESAVKTLFSSSLYNISAKDEAISDRRGASPDAVLCGAGASGLAISPDGTIRPCIGLMDKLGHYPSDSLKEIWRDSPWFEQWKSRRLSEIESCRECDKVGYCSRCPGAWKLETGAVDVPSAYSCFLAGAWSQAQGHS